MQPNADQREGRLDTEAIGDAADAVSEFAEALREYKEKRTRRTRYFWKAYPHIRANDDYLEATKRREKGEGEGGDDAGP